MCEISYFLILFYQFCQGERTFALNLFLGVFMELHENRA